MSPQPTSRLEALKDLVERRVPVATATAALRAFAWDQEELLDLQVGDILRLLAQFDAGEVSASELTDWADAVESRDDLGRQAGWDQKLNDALFALSSPELLAEDLPSAARRLRAELARDLGSD